MTTYVVIAIAILALVAVAAFIRYRSRAEVAIKGPMGLGIEVKGENAVEQPAAPARRRRSPPRGEARINVGGGVTGSTLVADAGKGGKASVDVAHDVADSDVLVETE